MLALSAISRFAAGAAAILLCISLAACGEDTYNDLTTDGAPLVAASFPSAGQTNVSVAVATFTVTFNEDVSGIAASNFSVSNVTGTVAYDAATRTATFTRTSSGLAPSTEYRMELGAGIRDAAGNPLAPVTIRFTTGLGGDTIAPVWAGGYPKAANVAKTSFQVKGKTDENATMYVVVVPAGSAAPNATVVRYGTNYGAVTLLFNGQAPLDGNVEGSCAASGLAQGTSYDAYVVAQDPTGNLSAAPAKLTVLTSTLDDANLTGLTSTATLDPVFSAAVYTYEASVANNVSSVDLTPVLAGAAFTVLLNGSATGVTPAGGTYTIALAEGVNTVTVEVVLAGYAAKTYTVLVTRAAALAARLSALAIVDHATAGAIALAPVFSAATYVYTAAAGTAVTAVDLTATAEQAGSTLTVKLNGGGAITKAGGVYPISGLVPGSGNVITVNVAYAGYTTKTYTLTLTLAD